MTKPPELPEEYAHIPVTGEVAEEQKPAQGRPGIAGAEDAEEPDISHRSGQKLFRVQLGKGFDQDGTLLPNTGVGVQINGILELNFGYEVTIYRTRQFDRIVFGCTSSFDFGVEFAATAEIKIPLGSALIFDHCADVHFTLGPYFIASITGIVRFTGSIGSSFGTETGADARCSCGDCSLSAEGFIGFGIGFEGYLLDRGAELSLEAGFKVALAPNDPHKGCGICYALTLSLELRFTAAVELGIFDLGIAPTLDIDFGHAYISDALGFGFGVCPNLTDPPEDPLADPGEWTPAESEDGLTDLQRYYYTFVELEDGYGVKRREESKILETALPEIPTYYNGKPVVEILPYAFSSICRITSVMLPRKLKRIGKRAFSSNPNYNFVSGYYGSAIWFPDTLESIGEGAFSGSRLTSIHFPASLTSIGNKAFSECPKLSSITLPRSLETLYFRAFDNYTRDSAYVITRESTVNGSTKTTFSYSSPRTITFLNPNTQFLDDPETLKSDYIPEGGYKPTIEYGNFLTLCGYPSSTAQAFAENPDHICRFIGLTSSSATVSEPTGEPQTMTFTGLFPNTVYNFYDLLGSSFTSGNLLYLSQGISDENGTLTVWYRPRMTDTNGTKYVRCNDSSLTETPAVTTTTEPATPVTTTTKPLTPVTTTTTKPMTPVQTTTPKAATTPKVTTAATTSRPISTVQGDANGDFVVDVSDAVLIARFCAEDSSADISRQGILNADVNRSGSPDPDDTIQILRFIAKLIKSF